jgi:U3 small nucleolar RNA-associated protein 25
MPRELHDCDFSRVKPWYLENKAKFLRQNIVCSQYITSALNRLVAQYFLNVAGKVKINAELPGNQDGSIVSVIPNVQQSFHRFMCASASAVDEVRFENFTKQIFKAIKSSVLMQSHVCIFIPTYFDFIRVRNWLDKQQKDYDDGINTADVVVTKGSPGPFSFTSLNEYTSTSNISRARSDFFHGKKRFLLVTERFHFFRRYRLRGIRHLVFYGLPDHSIFYPEFINMLMLTPIDSNDKDGKSKGQTVTRHVLESSATVTVQFCKYDFLALERIIGIRRAQKLVSHQKALYLFS